MKKLIFIFTILTSFQALAQDCAELYNKAIGNSKVFKIDDAGKVTVLDSENVAIFEKKSGLVTLREKGIKTRYVIRLSKAKDISSITAVGAGADRTVTFPVSCAYNESTQMITPGKLDAAEAAMKGQPAH